MEKEIQVTLSDSPLKFTYETPEGAVGSLGNSWSCQGND